MKVVPYTELRDKAQNAVLLGLPAGTSLREIERAVGTSNVRGYSPDVAMLELVIAALDAAGISRDQPVSSAGWRERYLPELVFRNNYKEAERLTYALHAAAAFRTGLRPDILTDIYGWHSHQLWPYATEAAVMTIRAAADGKDLTAVCESVRRNIRHIEPQPPAEAH
jgi:hypothetical protein